MKGEDKNSIIRVKKKDRYAALANSMLRDARLTFDARGLLSYLLSMPDDWEVRFSHLLKQSPAKRTALRRIIKECIAFGYMKRERVKAGGGRFQWVTEVYEDPREAGGATPDEASPWVGFRPMENPSAEDRSVDLRSAEDLPIYENGLDEPPKDERLNGKKKETTKAAARGGSQPAPPAPPPAAKVFIPIPFPLDAGLREWAARDCPLVNIDDATDKFVLQYSPEAVEKPPMYTLALWVTKWKTWMRREQKFELRDLLPTNSDAPRPQGRPAHAMEVAAHADYAACPDCNGTLLYYPGGYEKGVAKCSHKRMPRADAKHVGAGEVTNV